MHPDDAVYIANAPDQGCIYELAWVEQFKKSKHPVYTTDAAGWLTYYNDAAADLWGYRPELGKTRWCGSWRIFTLEGTPLPLDQCPMAEALKEGRTVRGKQAVLERPDGMLIPFRPYPTPLRDATGSIIAGSNLLLPLSAEDAPLAFELTAGCRTETPPADVGHGLELDQLTLCLQEALAVLADVEFGFQIDCERLDAWSGPRDEKEHIIRQLESKRQKQRDLLHPRLDQLRERAKQFMTHERADMVEALEIVPAAPATLH